MTWNTDRPHILSYPVQLRWAGWVSDTQTLQRHGWEFAAHEDPENRSMSIILKNDSLRIQGRSEPLQFEYIAYAKDPNYIRNIVLTCHLASRYQICDSTNTHFCAIDCEPTYELSKTISSRMINLSDLRVFRTVNPDIQKVYLEEPSMTEILNMAIKNQAPRQHEIRQQLLKRDHLNSIRRNSELSAELRLVA